MFRIVTTAAAALALAACSSGNDDGDTDGDGTISAEEASAAAAKMRPLEAGEYKMKMEIVDIVDPGANPEEIEQAKKFFSTMSEMAPPRCLNEEEAKEGMMGIAESIQNGDCTVEKMSSNADGMTSEMTCKAQNGDAKVVMESTSTGTEAEMTMTVTEPTVDSSEKRVVMKVGMTRQGDCSQ